MKQATKAIADFIHHKKMSVKQAFKEFDKDGSGGISYREFHKALKKWGFNYTKEQAYKLAEYVDTNGSKNISRREFRQVR